MIIKFPPDDFADQQVTVSSYSIHHSRLSAWLDYEDDSAVAGLDMTTRAMTHIEAHLRSLYLLEAIPERFFDLRVGFYGEVLRIPLREIICHAVDETSMILGLSRQTFFSGNQPTPPDLRASACVIEAVTEAFLTSLEEELNSTEPSSSVYGESLLFNFTSEAMQRARVKAICGTVDKFDGLTPDCDRDLLHVSVKARGKNGPPDPFGSKGRFRYDLMRAVIWWALKSEDKNKEYEMKPAESVTVEDVATFFSLLGYHSEVHVETGPDGYRCISPVSNETSCAPRMVYRWLKKYSSGWPETRLELIKTIRLTGYELK